MDIMILHIFGNYEIFSLKQIDLMQSITKMPIKNP
jgi:hypothetical protein